MRPALGRRHHMKRFHCTSVLLLALLLFTSQALQAAEWSVPLGGNAYHTAPQPSRSGLRRDGSIRWSNPQSVFSVYFRVDRPAALQLKILAREVDGSSKLRATVGDDSFEVVVDGSDKRAYDVGSVEVPTGYVRVDLQGIEKAGDTFAEVNQLVVQSDTEDLQLDYVKSNQGNMFYWGRRGPSVHLRYQVPRDLQVQYAYSELTVPVGHDPIGSYFMANGFGEGYFGMQVNGPEERRILFSVWSPFRTDNPRDIPEDQRVEVLARGPGVRTGEFGNEGSGGQSYLLYPWEAGKTYRYLTAVTPDGAGNTIYTSWFGDKSQDEWLLIARFRRPKTNTHLRGFHSFLESFSPTYGHILRESRYGNVWVCDTDGNWHECTQARFSVDATGGGRHRLDFTGGSDGQHFFLRNCGFFNETGTPGSSFTRDSTADQQPEIDFESLPAGDAVGGN